MNSQGAGVDLSGTASAGAGTTNTTNVANTDPSGSGGSGTTMVASSGGSGGSAVLPGSGGAGGATDSMLANMGGQGGAGATALPGSGGAGGATDSMQANMGGAGGAADMAQLGGGAGGATDSMQADMGGAGGAAAVDPELEALLQEGVGDIERPPPYDYGPYADTPAAGVPRGTVREFTFDEDEFYPQSPARGIKVYEPAQYEEGEEVFLSVFFDGTASWAYLSNNNDGGTYKTLNVFDNLIAEGLIPPFIGVFIGNDGDGGHRQSELAPIDDTQARFIIEGVLPAVEAEYGYTFSTDPKKRSITGESSGGNAAFTVAWNRPDSFHRMQGHSSSFSFDQATRFPSIIRETEEVKPLRIHLEGGEMDGRHHENIAAALAEKGYTYQWFNSTGSGHGGPGGDTSFPEGLIWLWTGWDRL